MLLAIAPQAATAAPPGAVISNTARLEYAGAASQPVTVDSNAVELRAATARTDALVELTRVAVAASGTWQEPVGPAACRQGDTYVEVPAPVLVGGSLIEPASPQPVVPTGAYNLGEPVFVRLADFDQNTDYQRIETATVVMTSSDGGDAETIRLTETGPNTGVFSGFVPTAGNVAASGDCVLQGDPQSMVQVAYADPADGTDVTTARAIFDPVQRVFDARSGLPVSGVSVTLVNAADGRPASVYGNDGLSAFPATIVSGGTITDSAGRVYDFGDGEYRFPVVPDGNYRLVIEPGGAYSAPSVVSAADLQDLPGAPYRIGVASYGDAFTKAGGLSFAFDIPVDARSESLFLSKRSRTLAAAPGDFVRFELTLENASASGSARDIEILDQLPAGLRYVPGSTRVDEARGNEPAIADARDELRFAVDQLQAGATVSVSYVTEVVGGRSGEELVNRASAVAAGGVVSNEASATLRIVEDLFRSTGTIIGRVLEADCGQETFGEEQGVAGVRAYLEDGSYAVSDEGGRFHFEGVAAGTHVVQIDTYSVPGWFSIVSCADTPGFAGRPDSQFVKLNRGGLQRADFYLRRKPAPQGRLDLELRSKGTGSPDEVAYDLVVSGVGNVAITNIDVRVVLPAGLAYTKGSMRVDGAFEGNPRVREQLLSFALPDRSGNWESVLEFVADIDSEASGELTTTATARFDTPIESDRATPVAETRMLREPAVIENAGYVLDLRFATLSAELSPGDRQKLDALVADWQGVRDIRISAVGHSDSQRISPANRHLFNDNYALSEARARSAALYVASALGLDGRAMQVAGRGPDEPIADNGTPDGRALNRRVEMVLSGRRPSQPSFLEVTQASSGRLEVKTRGAVPGTQPVERDMLADAAAFEREPDIESLLPGVAMLLPSPGFAPAVPATKLSVQHHPGQTVEAWVNGQRVNPVNFDSIEQNEAGTVVVSRWRGVELVDGENRLRAVVTTAEGTEVETLERTINFSGSPIRGEILAERSQLIADGRSRPVIAVRLYDRSGKPARRGVIGNFSVKPPYRSWWDVENDRKNPLVQIASRQPTYRIGDDGIALIELEPTTRTGEVELQLDFENRHRQELRTWISPAARDWILVGFAEGSAGYNTLSGNLESATAGGHEDAYYDDGRLAFFAKGRIKGEYLLTMAYDSDRERGSSRDAFRTQIDPGRYYPLYADVSEQRFEAPSQRKLYLKLERGQFFALFGDFETGLAVTDLARYQRRFNGFSSEYRGRNFGYTAFAAENSQAFNRDEIPGDGTSGLYRLSRAPIIANSDEIRIEVRDRLDPGVVLESRALTRYLDYTLDPVDGSLYFKRPVPGRDLDFNPVFIVAEYETRSSGAEDLTAGGRGSVRTRNDAFEIGVTHVTERTAGAPAELSGLDLRWQINDQTLMRAEVVESEGGADSAGESARAHLVELEHNSEKVDVRAYVREVEDGFGLGYQSAADAGVRRLGVNGRARLTERWSIEGEAGWQQRLASEDIRNLARAHLRFADDAFSGSLGVTHANDRFDDGETRSSDLVEVALTRRVMDGRLALRANGSTAMGNDAGSADFPTRTVLGADYRVSDGLDLVAEYEHAAGRDLDAQMTRLGVRAKPWSRAEIDTTINNEFSEYGPRLFANLGLVQGVSLGERWLLDFGVDQTNTLAGPDLRQFDPDRELASGSLREDYLAMFTGATYTADIWSANSRIEFRNADTEERLSLLLGWYREPTAGHGLSAGLQLRQADSAERGKLLSADLGIGWAFRPAYRRWSFLERFDLVLDSLESSAGGQRSLRAINNFTANRRISSATGLALQYAAKYVLSEFDDDRYTGYTDLLGLDLRHALSDRWDIGFSTSVYHSWRAALVDYGAGADIGYNLATNVWLSLGYNLAGFHDADFSEARYTAEGPFLRFSVKADQRTLKDIAGQR